MNTIGATMRTLGILCVGMMILVAGCSNDSGMLVPNQAPETVLTAAPPDTYNHIATFHWNGEDEDGLIMYFETSVDGGTWERTTATDTTIVFNVSDDAVHSFAVRAYDDDGEVDPSPAEANFTAVSIAPNTTFLDGGVPRESGIILDNVYIGPAITLVLDAEDPDDKNFEWRYQLDGTDENGWSDWQDSVFAFADPEIIEGGLGILSEGTHTFYGQARDAAGLIDPTPVSFTFRVRSDYEPMMDIRAAEINFFPFYADFSAFTLPELENDIHFEAAIDVSEYWGSFGGFSYLWAEADQVAEMPYSEWGFDTEFDFIDVGPGQYWFILKARDTAGTEVSDSIYVDIVNPATELDPNAILVIHETRNGTGRPGSPVSEQVVEHYDEILSGFTYDSVVYRDLFDQQTYVSPGVAGRYGTIIWVDDDATEHFIFAQGHEDNLNFLEAYASLRTTYSLDAPVHLMLSTWDLYAQDRYEDDLMESIFGVVPGSTNAGDKTYLKAVGTGPLAGEEISVDAEKLPSSFNGMLNKIWTFEALGEATALTTWQGGEPSELDGQPNAYYYVQEDIEAVILGYPLYFMNNSEVMLEAAMELFGF